MTSHELTQHEKEQVQSWAVGFNAHRPADGKLTARVIESVGSIPIEGETARWIAREYFVSKLPAALERRRYALAASDRSTVSEDWFNAPDYWNAVIAWLDAHTPESRPPLPDRPRWYYRDDAVELDRDIAVGGRPYRKGSTGKIMDLEDDTLADLARQGQVAVMLTGNDLIVVPVAVLLPSGAGAKRSTDEPTECDHPAWAQARFRWGDVDHARHARPFWQVSGCSRCGRITDEQSDAYYGDDMHLVHLKWRGSVW